MFGSIKNTYITYSLDNGTVKKCHYKQQFLLILFIPVCQALHQMHFKRLYFYQCCAL